jgi:hypothetical protein
VVDVGAAPGDTAVVQDRDLGTALSVQRLGNELLAAGAPYPAPFVRGRFAQGQQQRADARMLVAHRLLAASLAAFMLAAGAIAGGAIALGFSGHASLYAG